MTKASPRPEGSGKRPPADPLSIEFLDYLGSLDALSPGGLAGAALLAETAAERWGEYGFFGDGQAGLGALPGFPGHVASSGLQRALGNVQGFLKDYRELPDGFVTANRWYTAKVDVAVKWLQNVLMQTYVQLKAMDREGKGVFPRDLVESLRKAARMTREALPGHGVPGAAVGASAGAGGVAKDDDEEGEACGWRDLLGKMETDPDYFDIGCSLGPVYRESDGKELASLFDALVLRIRSLREAYRRTVARQSNAADGWRAWVEYLDTLEGMQTAQSLREAWCRAFTGTREAEKWLFRTLGPPGDQELLDEIADSLDTIHDAVEDATQASWWMEPDDEDEKDQFQEIEEGLAHLHGLARHLEALPGTRESGATGKEDNGAALRGPSRTWAAGGRAGHSTQEGAPASGDHDPDMVASEYLSWSDLLAEIAREERKGNLDPGCLGTMGYRVVTADELASILEALMLQAAEVWPEYAHLWSDSEPRPFSEEEEQALVSDEALAAVRRLLGACWHAIGSAVDAERWLQREVGPLAATGLLEEIAVGVQTAMRVVSEIEEIAEVRSPYFVESVREGSRQRYKRVRTGTQWERMPMSAEEIIAEEVHSCAELDESLLQDLDKFHRTIRRLREVDLGSRDEVPAEPKSRSKPKARKRRPGRPRVSAQEAERRDEILAAWEQAREAGVSRPVFCEHWVAAHPEETLTVKDLETFADWARQRRIRKDGTE